MKEKIQDQSRVKNQDLIKSLDQTGKRKGIANKPIDESIPTYELASSEKVITGQNNCFVILGRDRPGNLYSGYGGKGGTQAGRIDLIAGLGSSFKNKNGKYGPPNEDTILNPNFSLDAARVYISQRADIDAYMGLADTPRQARPGRSTVGIKADTLRFHARRDIKIVTGKAKFGNLGKDGERLSTGGLDEDVGTISLIAGNYTDDSNKISLNFLRPFAKRRSDHKHLQSIPKGDNLADCLEEILDAIMELSSIVGDNVSMIQKMDLALAAHTHIVGPLPVPPFIPVALAPSSYTPVTGFIQTKTTAALASRSLFNKNLELLKINYLNKYFGSVYINSKHVFTT